MKNPGLRYALISPARNEQDFLELTIKSMISQTFLPVKWVIVSDGSTDRTDEIASSYAKQYPWIDFLRMPERTERDFAGKVGAFNAGLRLLKDVEYDIVGSMDADLTFDSEYFEYLIGKFAENPKLGLGGTPFSDNGEVYDYRYTSPTHVSGACQMFRKECYEQIGGYVPMKGGGIDVVAVLSARMKGWETRTYTDKVLIHHRPMGSANHGRRLMAAYKLGEKGYNLGYHPLWQLFRSVYQLTKPPLIGGGCALFAGYFWAWIRRVKRQISPELVQFQQRDQMKRLTSFLTGRREKKSCSCDKSHVEAGCAAK